MTGVEVTCKPNSLGSLCDISFTSQMVASLTTSTEDRWRNLNNTFKWLLLDWEVTQMLLCDKSLSGNFTMKSSCIFHIVIVWRLLWTYHRCGISNGESIMHDFIILNELSVHGIKNSSQTSYFLITYQMKFCKKKKRSKV